MFDTALLFIFVVSQGLPQEITPSLFFLISLQKDKNSDSMISVKFNLKHKDKEVSNIFMSVYYGAFKISINKETEPNTGKQFFKILHRRFSAYKILG